MNTRDIALRYLATRARTCEEVEEFLDKKGCSSEEKKETLEYLKAMHYLDDEQYCKDYYDYTSRKGKSIHRIKYELQEKGIGSFTIEDALAALEEDEGLDLGEEEQKRAFEVAEKIARSSTSDVSRLPGKIGRRLKALGYESDVIYEIVGKYMKDEYD